MRYKDDIEVFPLDSPGCYYFIISLSNHSTASIMETHGYSTASIIHTHGWIYGPVQDILALKKKPHTPEKTIRQREWLTEAGNK